MKITNYLGIVDVIESDCNDDIDVDIVENKEHNENGIDATEMSTTITTSSSGVPSSIEVSPLAGSSLFASIDFPNPDPTWSSLSSITASVPEVVASQCTPTDEPYDFLRPLQILEDNVVDDDSLLFTGLYDESSSVSSVTAVDELLLLHDDPTMSFDFDYQDNILSIDEDWM